MSLRVLHTQSRSSEENMLLDRDLLNSLQENDCPILRFYDFDRDSATIGYFIRQETRSFLQRPDLLDIARRPTGGGVLFHLWDLTFSLFLPKRHFVYFHDVAKSYEFVHRLVLFGIAQYCCGMDVRLFYDNEQTTPKSFFHGPLFCFARPSPYDVVVEGKKVAGGAQRRKKNGLLHQSSIAIMQLDTPWLHNIGIDEEDIAQMQKEMFVLFPHIVSRRELKEARNEVRYSLQKIFTEAL